MGVAAPPLESPADAPLSQSALGWSGPKPDAEPTSSLTTPTTASVANNRVRRNRAGFSKDVMSRKEVNRMLPSLK